MKDLAQEQSVTRAGLWGLLCAAAVIFLSQTSEGNDSGGWFVFNIMVIAGCLIMAAIYGLQLRLLNKAGDGVTAQAYLRVGTSRRRPSWPRKVAMLLAMLLIVAVIALTGFEPDGPPWWWFAALGVALIWSVAIELRRLRAMAKPPRNDAGNGSVAHTQLHGVGDGE